MKDRKVLSRDPRRYTLPSERALGAETHSYLPELCDQLQTGKINRRDFLRQAALLGMATGTVYAMADKLGGGAGVIGSAMADEMPKAGGTLRCTMRVQEMTDPATFPWTERSNVSRFLVEYMTRTQSDNVTVPYLASSWEASDDLATWVFHLNEGITWSNGDAFTTADVAHTVNRWLDPAVGSSNLGLFGAMVEEGEDGQPRGIPGAVEVIDDHTIQFNLKQPALAMPENFYNYPTAIVHRGFGVDYEADLSANPIGTGPFELAEYALGEKAILRRARDWWAGAFYLDEIHYFDHGEDTNAWLAALASQQVDMVFRLPNNLIDAAQALPFVDLHPVTTAQTAVMRFRITEAPFDNLKLRQAVVACMDHQEILDKAFQGRGQIAENHHVCPIHPEYATLPPLKRDIEKAKALLAEAGHPDGITLEIANGDTEGPWMTDACAIFKNQAAPAGINIDINKMPANQYWELWDKAPWGYTAWTHRPLGTMVLGLAYRKGVPWNEVAYDNPAFDAALDDAEGTLDVNERRKKMEVCQKLLQDDAIIPQPFWRSVYKAANKRVKGHQTHPTLYHQFHNVWLDG